MPYKSDRQRRWAHTKTGMKKLGASKVAEFDRASKGMNLPERIKKKLKKAK
jgi:hypothetical protein